MSALCSIEGCGKTEVAKGWCSAHYYRQRRARKDRQRPGTRDRAPTRLAEEYPARFAELLMEEVAR